MTMRERILEYVKETGWVSLAELERLLGDRARGRCSLRLGGCANVYLWTGLSEDLADTPQTLLEEGELVMRPTTALTYLIDGAYPKLPVARGRYQYCSSQSTHTSDPQCSFRRAGPSMNAGLDASLLHTSAGWHTVATCARSIPPKRDPRVATRSIAGLAVVPASEGYLRVCEFSVEVALVVLEACDGS